MQYTVTIWVNLLIKSSKFFQIVATPIIAHRPQYTCSKALLQLFLMVPKSYIKVSHRRDVQARCSSNFENWLVVLPVTESICSFLASPKELDKKQNKSNTKPSDQTLVRTFSIFHLTGITDALDHALILITSRMSILRHFIFLCGYKVAISGYSRLYVFHQIRVSAGWPKPFKIWNF